MELIREIIGHCDLRTIVALRGTSRALTAQSEAVLRQDRAAVLRPLCDNPDTLWRHLQTTRAVVGGLAALSFMLRDPSLQASTVDVYVCNTQGDVLDALLENDDSLHLWLQQAVEWDVNDTHVDCKNVFRTTTYVAQGGWTLKVHTSRTLSALTPIATVPTTALMNWVSYEVFASAYPTLTGRRRALGTLPYGHHHTTLQLFNRLQQNGFSMKTHAAEWEDYASELPLSKDPERYPCARNLYVCVNQGRFFGDAGSLLAFFDISDYACRTNHQLPPYALGVAWRLITTHRPCNGPCVHRDPVLPRRTEAMLAVFLTTD